MERRSRAATIRDSYAIRSGELTIEQERGDKSRMSSRYKTTMSGEQMEEKARA